MPRADLPLRWKVEAGLAALLIPPLIHLLPLPRLVPWLGKRRRRPSPQPVKDQAAAEWVDAVLHRLPWPWRRTCLKRSAVLYHLLRREGVPVELRIGVRRDPSRHLAAHAWLTRNQESYLEARPDEGGGVEDFTEIACFPEQRPGIA